MALKTDKLYYAFKRKIQKKAIGFQEEYDIIKAYIAKHKIISAFALYFLISVILKMAENIDVCIPCLWTTILDFKCIGCGLTRSFTHLLELDFKKAFEINSLIFIIVPAMLYYFTIDYIKFREEQQTPRRQA
jgi:hypothetical protein